MNNQDKMISLIGNTSELSTEDLDVILDGFRHSYPQADVDSVERRVRPLVTRSDARVAKLDCVECGLAELEYRKDHWICRKCNRKLVVEVRLL